MGEGLAVGCGVGLAVGFGVGLAVGRGVGFGVGLAVGFGVGLAVGVGVAPGQLPSALGTLIDVFTKDSGLEPAAFSPLSPRMLAKSR